MPYRTIGLSGEQLRAARALARLEQSDLAKLTRLSVETIKRLENIRGQVNANVRTLNAIGVAFEGLGIHFEAELGVEGVWRATNGELRAHDPRRRRAEHDRQRLIYQGRLTRQGAERLRSAPRPAGLSGFALALDGQLLHGLEGPREAVQRYYGGVASLPTEGPYAVVAVEPAEAGLFEGWSFGLGRDDPALAAVLQDPGFRGAFEPARLSAADALALLVRAGPARTACGSPGHDPECADCSDGGALSMASGGVGRSGLPPPAGRRR